jgi:hypothetical protein
MAYWGIAVDLLGNSLSGRRRPKSAPGGVEALEKARALGARTAREGDWIER